MSFVSLMISRSKVIKKGNDCVTLHFRKCFSKTVPHQYNHAHLDVLLAVGNKYSDSKLVLNPFIYMQVNLDVWCEGSFYKFISDI